MADQNQSESQPASDESQSNVRSDVAALIWLSVAQSPLRAHELWMATQFKRTDCSTWFIEQLNAQDQQIDDRAAFASLQEVLGDMIKERQDAASPDIIYVAFSNPDLRRRIYKSETED